MRCTALISFKSFRELLTVAAELIYRSIFIGGDGRSRHVSIAIYLAITLSEIMIAREGVLGIIIALGLLLTHSLIQKMIEGLGYALILSLIPAAWYFLTTLPFTGSLTQSLEISLRSLVITASLTTFLQRINPMELAYLGMRLGIKNASLYMPLFWKITPHLMRDSQAALTISSLKGEEVWRGLAISFVALEEYNRYYNEGLLIKREFFKPTFWYDLKETLNNLGFLGCSLALLTSLLLLNA